MSQAKCTTESRSGPISGTTDGWSYDVRACGGRSHPAGAGNCRSGVLPRVSPETAQVVDATLGPDSELGVLLRLGPSGLLPVPYEPILPFGADLRH